jgi:hypothetical protein
VHTGHYITSDWQTRAVILATRDIDEKKTADNIRVIIDEILDEFHGKRPNNVYVTDNGGNIKAAFSDSLWISCTGHNLNLVMTHALELKHSESSPLADIHCHRQIVTVIQTCKDIVTRVKRTEKQSQLNTTLKQVRFRFLQAFVNNIYYGLSFFVQYY